MRKSESGKGDWAAAAVAVLLAAVLAGVLGAGFRWWTSLDAVEQVLALLAIGAVVALKIALGLLACLCGIIRRP